MATNDLNKKFGRYEICGSSNWAKAYHGPIRDGVFPAVVEEAIVARCSGCGIQRLEEAFCTPSGSYETHEYRDKLKQDVHSLEHLHTQDEPLIHTLKFNSFEVQYTVQMTQFCTKSICEFHNYLL